uniref:Uncharacterized protein n=1 Tax=Anguilla anguilla TaxID=7936 RepID=A0A0E9WD15_ANGAN
MQTLSLHFLEHLLFRHLLQEHKHIFIVPYISMTRT